MRPAHTRVSSLSQRTKRGTKPNQKRTESEPPLQINAPEWHESESKADQTRTETGTIPNHRHKNGRNSLQTRAAGSPKFPLSARRKNRCQNRPAIRSL
jgi:hypothetical protein